jgi:hypothetical protein
MTTRSALLQADSNETNIWSAFEGEGVEIAYPHSHQVFGETSRELQVSMVDDTAPEMPGPDESKRGGESALTDGSDGIEDATENEESETSGDAANRDDAA